MHHVCAYSVAGTTVDTDRDIPGVADGIYPLLNGHFVFPRPQRLIGAYAMGNVLARARISAPTFRQLGIPHIQPVDVNSVVSDLPPFMDLINRPLIIRENEEIAIQASSTAVTAQQYGIFLIVQEAFQPAPAGDPYYIRATGTTTTVAAAWTSVALTFQDQLPVGRYAVIGALCYGATLRAFRLTFDAQFQRPGGLGTTAEGRRPPYSQQHGIWGTWGTFATNSLPRLEVLANAADTAQELYIEVVKVSDRLA